MYIFIFLTRHTNAGFGIKPISKEGTSRLVTSAIEFALKEVLSSSYMWTWSKCAVQNRKSLTIVHKGNIMKFTEGAFKDWAYEVLAYTSHYGTPHHITSHHITTHHITSHHITPIT